MRKGGSAVRLTLTTWVEPAENGARISSTASAWTRGTGTSTGPIRCTSMGVLEREILKRVHLELAERLS